MYLPVPFDQTLGIGRECLRRMIVVHSSVDHEHITAQKPLHGGHTVQSIEQVNVDVSLIASARAVRFIDLTGRRAPTNPRVVAVQSARSINIA